MIQDTPVVLFGYEASTFTIKVRLVLKLKGIQYSFVAVPSMMPRDVLRKTFNLTYRKIPVLLIGRDLYCDTSLICEALEHHFGSGYRSIYPKTSDGHSYRALIRALASYWTDRPLFRATTGLIPATVWRTSFGKDRAQLIGHKLDADKLEKKFPENLARLDMHLSMLEDLLSDGNKEWIMSSSSPSMADISFWYQLKWGTDIAKGILVDNLTAGEAPATGGIGADAVFNEQRYPAVFAWYKRFEGYLNSLSSVESSVRIDEVIPRLKKETNCFNALLNTPQPAHNANDQACGLLIGEEVSITPDDTGREDPTFGTLVALSPEEAVLTPRQLETPPLVEVRIHFPRLGFVCRPVRHSRM